MKNTLPITVSFLFVSILVALPLHAANLSDLSYTTTGGAVTITDCNQAASGELVIPDAIEGNPVTSIGDFTFFLCSSLTSITIPDSVTSIGYKSFSDCSSLTSITFGENSQLASIAPNTFANCYSLTSIAIPDSVTSIGGGAFYNCGSLTSFIFRGNIPSLGNYIFSGVDENTVITALALGAKEKDTQIAQLEAQLAAVTAERDARPTQASYDAVVAERDARPTLDQVQDARVGSIVMAKDGQTGEVSLCFGLQKTDDLKTWIPFEGGTWTAVANGGVKLTLPLNEAKKLLRVTLKG